MITVPKPDSDKVYRDEILGVVQVEIDKHERSAQVEIGPSEVGEDYSARIQSAAFSAWMRVLS